MSELVFEASQIFLMEGNWVFLGVVARCWNEILIWDCLFTAIFGNISMEDMERMCNIVLNQTTGSECYTFRNLNDFYTVSSVFSCFLASLVCAAYSFESHGSSELSKRAWRDARQGPWTKRFHSRCMITFVCGDWNILQMNFGGKKSEFVFTKA